MFNNKAVICFIDDFWFDSGEMRDDVLEAVKRWLCGDFSDGVFKKQHKSCGELMITKERIKYTTDPFNSNYIFAKGNDPAHYDRADVTFEKDDYGGLETSLVVSKLHPFVRSIEEKCMWGFVPRNERKTVAPRWIPILEIHNCDRFAIKKEFEFWIHIGARIGLAWEVAKSYMDYDMPVRGNLYQCGELNQYFSLQ